MRIPEQRTAFRAFFWVIVMLSGSALRAQVVAQSTLPDAPVANQAPAQVELQAADPDTELGVTIVGTPKRMLLDEGRLVSSPLRLRVGDARWVLPFAATTGLLIGSDAHSITLEHINAEAQDRANKLTYGTLGVLGSLPAGMFLWSSVRYAPLARETSLLAGEAVGDALVLDEAGKAVFRRDRPMAGNGRGNFFDSSFSQAGFPSGQASSAWAIAAVIGGEYRGWLPRTAVYTLAAMTSVGRVVAEKHFPSDVLVGSALGWLVGHYVYRTHHDYALTPDEDAPAARWPTVQGGAVGTSAMQAPMTVPARGPSGTPAPGPATVPAPPAMAPTPRVQPVPQQLVDDLEGADPDTIGSTNVPMDSWVYPALERLAALGFVPSQNAAIRPWTRVECERQIAEASGLVMGGDQDRRFGKSAVAEAERLLDGLKREFDGREMVGESIVLASIYARYGNIAGPALADSYHFGQTWWNDFGRPLGRGGSSLLGVSGYATEGRMFAYVREELQQGPGRAAYSPAVEQTIAALDANPVQSSVSTASFVRQRPIELYAGVAFDGNAISLGKQELYWGPTTMGPLSFSSNAEPTYSLRFVSTRPHPLPFFPSFGSYRFDIVMGKLSGHMWPQRPWYNGQKATFNFGPNLELSFTRWSLLWGVGHPITLDSLIHNLDSFSSSVASSDHYGNRLDPGDRKSNFDFRYRLPWLRNEITIYADSYSDDDPSPVDAPRRALWNPGIYLARLPWLPRMDFRFEAVSSEGLAADFGPAGLGGQHFFYNNQYHDSNTNKGFLLGNAIGRDSRAEEGRVGWWISAETRVEAGYRQSKGGTLFLPGGSTISDGFVNARVQLSRHWIAQVFGQYERFLVPSYLAGAQTNKSGWLQLTWTPDLRNPAGKR